MTWLLKFGIVIAAGSFALTFGAGAARHPAGLAGADAKAAGRGAPAAMLVLFCAARGAKVNVKTGRGRTALMQANLAGLFVNGARVAPAPNEAPLGGGWQGGASRGFRRDVDDLESF